MTPNDNTNTNPLQDTRYFNILSSFMHTIIHMTFYSSVFTTATLSQEFPFIVLPRSSSWQNHHLFSDPAMKNDTDSSTTCNTENETPDSPHSSCSGSSTDTSFSSDDTNSHVGPRLLIEDGLENKCQHWEEEDSFTYWVRTGGWIMPVDGNNDYDDISDDDIPPSTSGIPSSEQLKSHGDCQSPNVQSSLVTESQSVNSPTASETASNASSEPIDYTLPAPNELPMSSCGATDLSLKTRSRNVDLSNNGVPTKFSTQANSPTPQSSNTSENISSVPPNNASFQPAEASGSPIERSILREPPSMINHSTAVYSHDGNVSYSTQSNFPTVGHITACYNKNAVEKDVLNVHTQPSSRFTTNYHSNISANGIFNVPPDQLNLATAGVSSKTGYMRNTDEIDENIWELPQNYTDTRFPMEGLRWNPSVHCELPSTCHRHNTQLPAAEHIWNPYARQSLATNCQYRNARLTTAGHFQNPQAQEYPLSNSQHSKFPRVGHRWHPYMQSHPVSSQQTQNRQSVFNNNITRNQLMEAIRLSTRGNAFPTDPITSSSNHGKETSNNTIPLVNCHYKAQNRISNHFPRPNTMFSQGVRRQAPENDNHGIYSDNDAGNSQAGPSQTLEDSISNPPSCSNTSFTEAWPRQSPENHTYDGSHDTTDSPSPDSRPHHTPSPPIWASSPLSYPPSPQSLRNLTSCCYHGNGCYGTVTTRPAVWEITPPVDVDKNVFDLIPSITDSNNILQSVPGRYDDEYRYKCSYCPNTYKHKHALKKHVKNKHSSPIRLQDEANEQVRKLRKKDDSFRCCICSQSFESFNQLRTHLREHRARYICEMCGKRYIEKAFLKRHLINVHDVII